MMETRRQESRVWEYLVRPEFVLYYSIGIVGWAVSMAIIFLWKAGRLGLEMKQALRTLPAAARDRRAAFRESYEDVDAKLRKNVALGAAWAEFAECLIHPRSDPQGRRLEEPIRNTRDPGQYFSVQSVILPRLNLRFFDSMPGQLTGVGILGTFLGLAAGINLAQTGLESTELDVVQDALGRLLDGASLAFVTSIVGLISSIVFLWIERTRVSGLRERLRTWIAALDDGLLRVTPEQIADRQLSELTQQTAELQTFSTDLAVNISNALDQKMADRLSPAMDRLIRATEGLRTDQQSASEEMLQKIVAQFSQTMSGAAGQEFSAISRSLHDLDRAIQSSVSSMRQQEQQSSAALAQVADKMAATLANGSTRIREDFERSTQTLLESTELAMAAMTANVHGAAEAATESSRKAIGSLGEEMKAALGGAGRELTTVTGLVAQSLEAAGQNASTTIGEASQGLAERAQDLSDSLDHAGELTLRMNSAAQRIRDAALAMSETLEGLRTISPALHESSGSMRQAGQAAAEASSSIAAFGTQAKDAATRIEEHTEEMAQAWSVYSERFEGTDESLAAVFSNLDSGLSGFATKINEFMSELDRNVAKSISTLSGAVQELDGTIEALIEAQGGTHG